MQRIFIIVIAVVFTASTLGIGLIYVLDARNQSKNSEIQAGLAEAQKQFEAQNSAQTNSQKETKLEGTKLQGFTPVSSVSSLQISDPTPGTGKEVQAGDTVTVHYTGALAKDGTIFQSSYDAGQTATFGLNQVIKGWTQGIPGMKEGGTRRLVIPAALAYGAQEQNGIPANSDLVFDVTLVKVGQ